MTTKSPWGTIGAWAAEAERADEEEKLAAELAASNKTPPPSFPSLKESVTASTKQKKKTKMSLHEFNTSSSSSNSTRLTPDEMMRLPTRPQDRSPDEMQHGRMGGGFSNYGARSGPGGQSGPGRIGNYGESDGRRRYGGFGEGGGVTSPRVSEFEPSRADEVDNWASMKRSQQVLSAPSGRPTRYADLGGGGGGGGGVFSRADEVDNWASMKKSQPVIQSGHVSSRSSFGSGFRHEMRPVGGDSERWMRNSETNKDQERTLGVEQNLSVVKVNKPNPFGEARPREEVLTEKGVDWKKLDEEIEVKKVGGISRPNSSQSQSSRPGSGQSVRSDGGVLQKGQLQEGVVEVTAVKMKPKVNPFGEAKPREILLAEKGVDWRKIDLELEHKRIDRPETDEEKNLKEEIESLKKNSLKKSGEEESSLHDEIIKKEKDLELLIQELDNKVRFGQKNIDRPGSGSGRYSGPPARLSSYPGPSEEPRGAAEFNDRPRSRGTVESWPRQNDDRRSFSGGRGGFLGSREHDRSVARNRW